MNNSVEENYKRQQNWLAYRFISPSILHYAFFFITPLFILFLYSFYHHVPGGIVDTTMSFENYKLFFGDPFYREILLRSFILGLVVTVSTLLIGYPIAYFMSISSERTKSICYVLVLAPLYTSVVVRTYGWMIILGRTGVLNKILMRLGLIDDPIQLMYTFNGVVITLVEVFLPFMILSIHSILENINKSLLFAAQNLGASKSISFLLITLPLSIPGIASGCILVFVLSIASFVSPVFIGGTGFRVIPTLIYEKAMASLNWPFGAAIAFSFLFIMVIIVHFYNRITSSERWSTVK